MCNVIEITVFFIALPLILLVYICLINTQNQNYVTLLLNTYQILFRYAERYCDDKEIMDNIMHVVPQQLWANQTCQISIPRSLVLQESHDNS